MKVGDICVREVIYVEQQEPILTVAELMRQHHVGSVLVVTKKAHKLIPVGILTDRDLVVEIIAPNIDPTKLLAQDVMVYDLVVVNEIDEMWEVANLMQAKGIRRVPVVDHDGFLVGIFCMDDIMEIVTSELNGLIKLMEREKQNEIATRI